MRLLLLMLPDLTAYPSRSSRNKVSKTDVAVFVPSRFIPPPP